MATAIFVILGMWLLPAAIYVLHATKLIGVRGRDVLLGIAFIAIGLSFITLCVFMYFQSGETIEPVKGAYKTLDTGDPIFWHFVSWLMWGGISGFLVWFGWGYISRRPNK